MLLHTLHKHVQPMYFVTLKHTLNLLLSNVCVCVHVCLSCPVSIIVPISSALIQYNESCLSFSPDMCLFLFSFLSSLCTEPHITLNSTAKSGSFMLPSLSANTQTTQNIISDIFEAIRGHCWVHISGENLVNPILRRLVLTSVEGLHSLFWH